MAGDPFLSDPSKKRKRPTKNTSRNSKPNGSNPKSRSRELHDEEISGASDTDDEEPNKDDDEISVDGRDSDELSSDEEFGDENAADKRRRLAKQYLENLKQNELGGADEDDEFFDAQDLDDDIVSRRLQTDVAEQKGYVYKFIGEKVKAQLEDVTVKTTRIGSKSLTSMAIRAPYVYTVSKDCELIKWEIGANNKIDRIKHTKGGSRKFLTIKNEQRLNHHCDHILCVAASPDGKYVVTGGADGRLIVWSSENLSCLKVLETRSAVNLIVFRRGTDQLYAACADLRIRTYLINQFAQLEVLYGHQDNVTEVSCLSRETCVSVGSRDKTALFWKIAEESRLTFRGGDSTERRKKRKSDKEKDDQEEQEEAFHAEGSIEVVSMVDESHFVTGSDNGNLALWSLAKKKALFTKRLAHGLRPALTPSQASAEVEVQLAQQQVPEPLPYWITAIHAVPFSEIFVSGSYDGCLKVWKLDQEGLRSFQLIGEINNIKGCVVKIEHVEIDDKRITISALTSKEHRLGRWLDKVDGARNSYVSFTVDI